MGIYGIRTRNHTTCQAKNCKATLVLVDAFMLVDKIDLQQPLGRCMCVGSGVSFQIVSIPNRSVYVCFITRMESLKEAYACSSRCLTLTFLSTPFPPLHDSFPSSVCIRAIARVSTSPCLCLCWYQCLCLCLWLRLWLSVFWSGSGCVSVCRMWMAGLRAHGIEKGQHFGGDSIIVVSLSRLMLSSVVCAFNCVHSLLSFRCRSYPLLT